ncbi:MAG: hypothetical protein Q7R97_02340 [Candidatus Daviesbacteria bacterium]|nr:hypothetical protein [Candidatus Daviesbacteria bacterium]
MFNKECAVQPLSLIYRDPSVLIPARLLELVADPTQIRATTLPEFWIGRMDDEYVPSLRIGIYKKDGLHEPRIMQETDDISNGNLHNWNRILNLHRRKAIKEGTLTEKDNLLALLIAHESLPYGVNIINYIQAPFIQKQGIGQAFLTNFGQIIKNQGFKYSWGEHNSKNISFFINKIGNYPLTEIDPQCFKNLIDISPTIISPLNTINFLDKELERKCVKSEFLHPQLPRGNS